MICHHAHTRRDGESYWCEDCGSALFAGTTEWLAPRSAALVEMQTRALLAVEWSGETELYSCTCPACGGRVWTDRHPSPLHGKKCEIDAALTAAGLDTQEKRDAARKDLHR